MQLRNLVAVGTAAGIEILDDCLNVVVARVRPSGVEVAARLTIQSYRTRPAAEWGAEYTGFLRKLGLGHISATVLLPRRDVIVRQIHLPGVKDKDLIPAIGFQIENLHPYGDEDVAWAWQRISSNGALLLGIVRQQYLQEWLDRFAEAGVALAGVTFSPAVLFCASRVYGVPASRDFLAARRGEAGGVELYGESASRPLFSAEFDTGVERAAPLALAELRLPAGTPLASWEGVLPPPRLAADFDVSRNAFAYAAALAGAVPRLAPAANLLPEELRVSRSRAALVPSIVLGIVLTLLSGALLGFNAYSEKRYLATIRGEIGRLQPKVAVAAKYDKATLAARQRIAVLNSYRKRTRSDLDALAELTRLIAPPAWTNYVQIDRSSVVVAGEADQAAPLLQILDQSPHFKNSQFSVAIARTGAGDLFRIRSEREMK